MSEPQLYPHAAAIVEALVDGGLRVGDHVAPKSDDGAIVAPCVVVYMTPSAPPFGSIAHPDTDVLIRFQLTAVGLTAAQAANYADRVHTAIDGAVLDVDGRSIFRVRRSSLARIERDDDVRPPCFYAPTPYQLMSMSNGDDEGS